MAVSDNWQKAAPSSTFGTPALDFYVIDLGTDVEDGWADSNSMFSRAVRGVQLVANLYFVGRPNGNQFTVAVASNTCPGRNPGAIGGVNTILQDAINSTTGTECAAYYAAFDGDNLDYND
jgi:hypothetical protein